MGSSGQPIEDIIKASGETDISPLEWLKKTLCWKHMCPTAPDTLPIHPYSVKDPFIINYCPDIYFVGNTNEADTKLWKGKYYIKKIKVTYVLIILKNIKHKMFI